MSRWPIRRLSEVVNVADGPFGSKLKSDHYKPSGVRVVRLQNIGLGSFNDTDRAYVSEEHAATMPNQRVYPGDVLVASLGEGRYPAGRACIYPEGLPPAINKADCFRLRLARNALSPDYLVYLLNSPAFRSALAESSQGATRPRLNTTKLGTLNLPLPPLEEQRRIVARLEARLGASAAVRDRMRAQATDTLALALSLKNGAFGSDAPVTIRPREGRWPVVPLAEVARLESGHTPSRRHPEWWGGEVRWLALPDIRAVDGKEVYETADRTNELGLANSSARLLPPGTVAFSRTASVGFVTILGREMATSQDFAAWICGPRLRPWYLMHALRHTRGHLLKEAAGAIHKTIYMPDLKAFRISLPPLEEQDRILARLDAVEREADAARAAIGATLAELDLFDAATLREAFA